MVGRNEIDTHANEFHHIGLRIDSPHIDLHPTRMGIPYPTRILPQGRHRIVDTLDIRRHRPWGLVTLKIADKRTRDLGCQTLADGIIERDEINPVVHTACGEFPDDGVDHPVVVFRRGVWLYLDNEFRYSFRNLIEVDIQRGDLFAVGKFDILDIVIIGTLDLTPLISGSWLETTTPSRVM